MTYPNRPPAITPKIAQVIKSSINRGAQAFGAHNAFNRRAYHHPNRNPDRYASAYHRITKGLTTACCENCPTGARQLVDFKNPKDPVHEFLRTNKVEVLKPYMATQSKVYYKNLDGAVR